MPRRTGLDGFIRARSPAVSVERAVFRLSRSPPLFTEAGSSSRERSALLQRRFDCHVPGMTRAPSLGFGPASRHQRPESTFDEVPSPRLCSARSVSHALDGLLLQPPCGLVSSHCHVQGFASGVSSHQSVAPTCRRRVPPRRWRRAPAFACALAPAPDASTSRFVLPGDPQFPRRGLVPRGIRVPSCVLAPSGFIRQDLGRLPALRSRPSRHRTACPRRR